MNRYKAYKDSGIQWVGEIPTHWETVKLIYTGIFENGLTYSTEDIVGDDGILVLRSSNVQNERITFDDCVYVSAAPKDLMVAKGDVIICSRNGSAALVGKCAIIEDDIKACFGAFMMRYKPNIENKFAFYLFTTAVDGYRGLFSTSTINQLTMNIIKQMQVVLPPAAERQTVAAYLDHKVGQINAAIAEMEQQLEDLKAYRSAMISEAVTKGLDKNVEMKDSGIEWIGMIPRHWDVLKIKYLSNMLSGINLTSEQILKEGKYPVYGGNGIRGYYNDFNAEGICVLVGRQGALCGNIKLAEGKFWATEHAVVCHPTQNYNAYWFAAILETMNLNQYSQSSAQPGLSVERIKNLSIPIPPITEQTEIGTFVKRKEKQITSSLHGIQTQIADLKSYKSALITEAVTGKIDLRDWKPKEENA